jgi:hypothetical protein
LPKVAGEPEVDPVPQEPALRALVAAKEEWARRPSAAGMLSVVARPLER